MKQNILLSIQYDGTNFSGWQRQPGIRTVQGTIEDIIGVVINQEVSIRGVSRTDAGVHAHQQMAQFCAELKIPIDKFAFVLNNALAKNSGRHGLMPDIFITAAQQVPLAFDVRGAVVGKKYSYFLETGPMREITLRNSRYFVDEYLCVDKMRIAAEALTGMHDFSSFKAAGGDPEQNPNKTIYGIKIFCTESGENKFRNQSIRMDFYGDSFLYKQVRIMSGTLIDVGMGKIPEDSIESILNAKERQLAGHTAPPQGLILEKMFFDKDTLVDESKNNFMPNACSDNC